MKRERREKIAARKRAAAANAAAPNASAATSAAENAAAPNTAAAKAAAPKAAAANTAAPKAAASNAAAANTTAPKAAAPNGAPPNAAAAKVKENILCPVDIISLHAVVTLAESDPSELDNKLLEKLRGRLNKLLAEAVTKAVVKVSSMTEAEKLVAVAPDESIKVCVSRQIPSDTAASIKGYLAGFRFYLESDEGEDDESDIEIGESDVDEIESSDVSDGEWEEKNVMEGRIEPVLHEEAWQRANLTRKAPYMLLAWSKQLKRGVLHSRDLVSLDNYLKYAKKNPRVAAGGYFTPLFEKTFRKMLNVARSGGTVIVQSFHGAGRVRQLASGCKIALVPKKFEMYEPIKKLLSDVGIDVVQLKDEQSSHGKTKMQ